MINTFKFTNTFMVQTMSIAYQCQQLRQKYNGLENPYQ